MEERMIMKVEVGFYAAKLVSTGESPSQAVFVVIAPV